MNKSIVFSLVVLLGLTMSAVVVAQTDRAVSSQQEAARQSSAVADRQQQLESLLQQLQQNEAKLGARHPSRPDVEDNLQIAQANLDEWNRMSTAEKENWSKKSLFRQTRPSRKEVPDSIDNELFKVIAQMNNRIERLEKRIQRLENTAN